jgi:UDP-N-acetylglucosamine--N-acetylmuramyl-(pentapeptide) pyrophosphoryl-undecaprenol N-acetylglucosamine transferase
MAHNIVCIVAGKSGGHIVPGMTLAQRFVERNPDYKILFFSTDTQLDKSVVALYPFVFSYIPLSLSNFPGKKVYKYPLFVWQLISSFFKSFVTLLRLKPHQIISMGGYVSIPVCIAGWLLRIPITVYELNAVPGKAVKVLAPFARTVTVCFPQARSYFSSSKVKESEYPLRFKPEDQLSKAHACMQLGLDPARKTLLILGGSQGSRFINDISAQFIAAHKEIHDTLQVIHQAGAQDLGQLQEFYKQHTFPVLVFDYRPDLQLCYAAADIVLARAGAGTLFELAFFQKHSLIVPLETRTTAHQKDNAHAMRTLRPDLFHVVEQSTIAHKPEECFKILQAQLVRSSDS